MLSIRKLVANARQNTFNKWVVPLLVGALGFVISLPIYWYFMGRETALEEALTWLFSAVGAVGAVILLFLWNFVCAPYRIEKAKRKTDLSKIKLLRRQNKKLQNEQQLRMAELNNLRAFAPKLKLRFEKVISGDLPEAPHITPIIAILTVRNKGGSPSGAFDWHFFLTINGERRAGVLRVVGNMTTQDAYPDIEMKIDRNSSIIEKCETPISAGGRVMGYIIAEFPKSFLKANERPSCLISIECKDVNDEVYSETYEIDGSRWSQGLPYIPGMNYTQRNT